MNHSGGREKVAQRRVPSSVTCAVRAPRATGCCCWSCYCFGGGGLQGLGLGRRLVFWGFDGADGAVSETAMKGVADVEERWVPRSADF